MHKENKGRQSSQKWDSFATMVSVSLKAALKEYRNVSFEIPETPYALIAILGHKFLITHSDTFLTVGRVGKTISTDSIKNKINDLVTGLGKIDVVVVGHIHTASYTSLDNGTQLVSNGCMSGIDSFAQSIGIVHNDPIQQMFEVTEKHPVGDIRFVRLLEADKMPELESIIEPFVSNF
jgi:UDP-2,3-diacylglucosamine pyrophosphatase LpxH